MKTLLTQAQTILSTTNFPGLTQDLHSLLTEILNTPSLLSHERMESLLNILCDQKLPQVISFIVKAETAPLPQNLRGTFFYHPAINDQHANCRILLNNVTKQYNESDIFRLANGLLQTTLLIYKSFELEEISLKDSKESISPVDKTPLLIKQKDDTCCFSGCNLF